MKKMILLTIVSLHVNIANAQWQQASFDSLQIQCLAVTDSNIIGGSFHGAHLSINNGNTWALINNGLPTNTHVYSLARSGVNIFAGTISDGVFLSTNNGGLWISANNGLPNQRVNFLAINGTNIFAGIDSSGLYLSTNNGGLWSPINNGLNASYVFSVAMSGTNIFAATTNGVFLSTNNGGLWTAINNGLTDSTVSALAISGTNIFAGTNGGVFLSNNNGGLWTAVNTGLTNTRIASLTISGSNVFAGTYSTGFGGVFLSTNNGGLWTPINLGLSYLDAMTLTVNSTTIFAEVTKYNALSFTIWRRPLSEITGLGERKLNEHFTLYPNPTNGKFRVESMESRVLRLEAWSVLGEKIYQSEVNSLESEIDLSNQPNGIYYINIKTEEGFVSKKIIINR